MMLNTAKLGPIIEALYTSTSRAQISNHSRFFGDAGASLAAVQLGHDSLK